MSIGGVTNRSVCCYYINKFQLLLKFIKKHFFYNFFLIFTELEYSPIKTEYLNLFILFIFSILLSILILLFSFYLVKQNPNSEKLSAYECGFEPYDDTRHVFDVKFCVIAILFVVFDIEIMFLIPWCVSVSNLNILGIWSMIDFLFELTVGFFFVWYSNALEWDQKT
jgi:NADH-quinone oxidoreductase subunit A